MTTDGTQAQASAPTAKTEPNAGFTVADSAVVDTTAQTGADNQPAGGSQTLTAEEVDQIVKRRIDKQNEKHREAMDAKQAELDKALSDLEAAKAEATTLQQEKARRVMVDAVATESGLSVEQVELLKGDSQDELLASANAFKAAIPQASLYPAVADTSASAPAITADEILAIKNREERVIAMATHPELFRE